jgi:hypothetical protein
MTVYNEGDVKTPCKVNDETGEVTDIQPTTEKFDNYMAEFIEVTYKGRELCYTAKEGKMVAPSIVQFLGVVKETNAQIAAKDNA